MKCWPEFGWWRSWISIALICLALTNCATIHKHPKATAIIVSAAIAIPVGIKLGYQAPCKSYYSGVPYNGTPPCPKSCEGPGDCYWPPKK